MSPLLFGEIKNDPGILSDEAVDFIYVGILTQIPNKKSLKRLSDLSTQTIIIVQISI